MRQIDVIRRQLPEARAQLGHFYVIKWIHDKIRISKQFGTYEADVLQQMKHTITNMTYTSTEGDNELHRADFKSLSLSVVGILR